MGIRTTSAFQASFDVCFLDRSRSEIRKYLPANGTTNVILSIYTLSRILNLLGEITDLRKVIL